MAKSLRGRIWWAVAAWGLATLYLIAMRTPGMQNAQFLLFPHYDKVVHALLFGSGAWLLAIAFWQRPARLLWAAGLSSAYGALTEVLQFSLFRYRSGDLSDWLADTAGALMGALLAEMLLDRLSETAGKPTA